MGPSRNINLRSEVSRNHYIIFKILISQNVSKTAHMFLLYEFKIKAKQLLDFKSLLFLISKEDNKIYFINLINYI